jgi:hypothetical protein
MHTGTTGDMRTFAEQTEISITTMPFKPRQNVVGSQYLFKDWVEGSITDRQGTVFSGGFFNMDKITQNIYLRIDSNVTYLVDKRQLVSLSLNSEDGSYLLEKVPSLDTNQFYSALVKEKKYSLYSFTKTKFIPADYQTNGIVTSGNLYDEYRDEITYYVIFPDASAHPITLKEKAIRTLFESEKDKVNQFFKTYSGFPMSEYFISTLVTYLNQ